MESCALQLREETSDDDSCGKTFTHSNPEFAAQFRPCLRKPEDDQQLYHKTIRVIIPMLMGRHQCSAT